MRPAALRAILALAILPIQLCCQTPTNKPKIVPADSLSKPIDMGAGDHRLFEDDAQKIRFKLVTSWIPGEKHQGMIRYRLIAFVPKAVSDNGTDIATDESAEKLLKRAARCTITLEIYDKDDFIVRRRAVPFIKGVDEERGKLVDLTANDTLQMGAEDYRQFLVSGAWSISWDCGI